MPNCLVSVPVGVRLWVMVLRKGLICLVRHRPLCAFEDAVRHNYLIVPSLCLSQYDLLCAVMILF